MRGAALGIHISSRRARRHYGTEFSERFISGVHPLKNLTYCPYGEGQLCDHCMEWYITRVSSLHDVGWSIH